MAKTIRRTCEEFLCHVTHWEERDGPSGQRFSKPSPTRRSVGYDYGSILAEVQRLYPGCETSLTSLRWYAVKIRIGEAGDDMCLPQTRPRTKHGVTYEPISK